MLALPSSSPPFCCHRCGSHLCRSQWHQRSHCARNQPYRLPRGSSTPTMTDTSRQDPSFDDEACVALEHTSKVDGSSIAADELCVTPFGRVQTASARQTSNSFVRDTASGSPIVLLRTIYDNIIQETRPLIELSTTTAVYNNKHDRHLTRPTHIPVIAVGDNAPLHPNAYQRNNNNNNRKQSAPIRRSPSVALPTTLSATLAFVIIITLSACPLIRITCSSSNYWHQPYLSRSTTTTPNDFTTFPTTNTESSSNHNNNPVYPSTLSIDPRLPDLNQRSLDPSLSWNIPNETQPTFVTTTMHPSPNAMDAMDSFQQQYDDDSNAISLADPFDKPPGPHRNEILAFFFEILRQMPPNYLNRLNTSAAVMNAARLVELSGSEVGFIPQNSLPPLINITQAIRKDGGSMSGTNGDDAPSAPNERLATSSSPPGITAQTPAIANATAKSSFAGSTNLSTQLNDSTRPRPYFGDAFFSFQQVYWPIHCVICLVICTLGIFANVTNIIVLTRPNMITAVNTILSAMALSDLVVNVSNIPYLIHELTADITNEEVFFSYNWAIYILLHAHITVTAHTISMWLCCVLATWRYLVVCRSQSSSQRNWTTNLALRAIMAVVMFVPVFCIPNYLSFSIVKERGETANHILFKVGFSELAESSQFIRTFHFSIFSILTKLVPCVLLTFFTTVLIRMLLKARERRLRLTSFGAGTKEIKKVDKNRVSSLCPAEEERRKSAYKQMQAIHDSAKNSPNGNTVITQCDITRKESGNENNEQTNMENKTSDNHRTKQDRPNPGDQSADMVRQTSEHNETQLAQQQQQQQDPLNTTSHSTMDTFIQPCDSDHLLQANSELARDEFVNDKQQQFHKSLNQLIVESTEGDAAHHHTTTTTTTTATATTMTSPKTNHMIVSCDTKTFASIIKPTKTHSREMGPRSASTCGALEHCSMMGDCQTHQRLPMPNQRSYLIQQHSPVGNPRRSPLSRASLSASGCPSPTRVNNELKLADKRASEATIDSKGRPLGRTTLLPFQLVKIQTTQRQLSQNETTTRLLIAVMIVFLICEFPAGILAALCAILGQEFFDNVYQPFGLVMDLLALINSSVNFILYCFMSTQFRVTFYQVVLRCPNPNLPQKQQANNNNNNNNIRAVKEQNNRENMVKDECLDDNER